MNIRGFDAQRQKSYRWRYGDPARDLTLDGDPVQPNYVVIVRLKQCRIWTCTDSKCGRGEPTHQHYDAREAPQAVRLNYGGTGYGYGEWKQGRTEAFGKKFADECQWYCPVFIVYDGYVYRAVQRRSEPPESARLRLFGKGILVSKDRVLK